MSDKPKTEMTPETTLITEGRGHRQMDKMNMFIGWSGPLSQSIASFLRTWIQLVIPDADPWMSEEDLPKGHPWRNKLETQLIKCDASLTVVTRENQSSPWLLFEAGAVSLALREKPCCTILVDLKATDVQGPLAALQHTLVDRKDMLRLVTDLNKISKLRQGDDVLKMRFEQNWKALESHVAQEISERQTDAATSSPKREMVDLVEENLLLARSMRTSLAELKAMVTAGLVTDLRNQTIPGLSGITAAVRARKTLDLAAAWLKEQPTAVSIEEPPTSAPLVPP